MTISIMNLVLREEIKVAQLAQNSKFFKVIENQKAFNVAISRLGQSARILEVQKAIWERE